MAAGGQGVDEVDHERLEGRKGHAPPADAVGRDDPVGARPLHARHAHRLAHAGDDEQAGVEGLGGEDDVGVAGVGVGGGQQAAGALDAGFEEGSVGGGVAFQQQVVPLAGSLQGLGVGLDDDERRAPSLELTGDLLAHAAEAAQDVMVAQSLDLSLHSAHPQQTLQLAFHGYLHHRRQDVQDNQDAQDDDSDRENASRIP